MLVAPTKVGKSKVIEEVLRMEPDWREAGSITTRSGRPNDPSNYVTGVPVEEMRSYIDRQVLINYAVMDTGHIYGTFPDGFAGDINLLPTQFRNVEVLQNAGFKQTESIFLVTEAERWREALLAAGMEDKEYKDRLDEGIASLEFALLNASEPWLHFVENSRQATGFHIAAQKVIAITNRFYEDEKRDKRIAQLKAMLEVAKDEIAKV